MEPSSTDHQNNQNEQTSSPSFKQEPQPSTSAQASSSRDRSTPTPTSNNNSNKRNNNSNNPSRNNSPSPAPRNTAAASCSSTTTNYEIRWNNYTTVLQNVFRRVLNSHQFSDVTLACEGETIKCHRILLAACSSYFEKILNQFHDTNLVIYMKDMKMWELQALVNFMYCGELSVSDSQLGDFMKAAESCNINGLDFPSSLADENSSNNNTNGINNNNNNSYKSSNKNYGTAKVKKEIINVKTEIPSPPRFIQSRAPGKTVVVHRSKPVLVPQTHSYINDNKRKIMDSPPKLIKMQRISAPTTRPFGVNNLGVKSSSWKAQAGIDDDDAEMIQFERAQLAQLLENGNYDDVEDDMDRIEVPGDEGGDDEGQDDDNNYSNGDDASNQGGQGQNDEDNEGMEDNEEQQQQYDNDDGDNYDGNMAMMFKTENNNDGSAEYDDEQSFDGTGGNSQMDGGEQMQIVQQPPRPQRRYAPPPRAHNARTYSPELQDAAFDALRSGVSIRQCSELFGIPRKTLAKWKNKGLHLQDGFDGPDISQEPPPPLPRKVLNGRLVTVKKRGPATGSTVNASGPEGADRAQRLQKATKMAMGGITVRQAAAHFDIPRTTLCAYMKRQGFATTKRTPNSSPMSSVNSNQNYSNQRQRVVGSTVITMSRNGQSSGQGNYRLGHSSNFTPQNNMNDMDEDEIPFLGLSDYIEQISE